MGLVGAASEMPSFIFNLIVVLVFTIHFLGCFWIYLGKTVEDSWLYEEVCKKNCDYKMKFENGTIMTDKNGTEIIMWYKNETDGRIQID